MALFTIKLEVGLSQVQCPMWGMSGMVAQTRFELGSCGISKLPGIFPQQHTWEPLFMNPDQYWPIYFFFKLYSSLFQRQESTLISIEGEHHNTPSDTQVCFSLMQKCLLEKKMCLCGVSFLRFCWSLGNRENK